MKENLIRDKTFQFALKAINLYTILRDKGKIDLFDYLKEIDDIINILTKIVKTTSNKISVEF